MGAPAKILLTLFCLCLIPLTAGAELRDFEDSFGRTIKAKLVSHTGATKESVTIAKADGKEFEVKLETFSKKDQAFIKAWMAKTPPSIKYSFRIEADRKPGDPKGRHYYEVSVINLSRDTVAGFSITTRTFCTNQRPLTTSAWRHYGDDIYAKEETFEVDSEVRFNQRAKVVATQQYRVFGIFVRVHDKAGKLIAEEKIGTARATKFGWDDGKNRSEDAEESKTEITIE